MLKAFSSSSHGFLSRFKPVGNPFNRRLTFAAMSTAAVKRVGTHDGEFHCDEALGCFLIRLTEKFSNAHIVRTRDPQVLETMDAVVDVGGVYDPARYRYDHHQKRFEEIFGHGFTTKLSSAGLVYKHFGKEIIAKELQVDIDHPDVQRLFLKVYKKFMEEIDAVDNRIDQYDTDKPLRYQIKSNLLKQVEMLNLDWTDPDQSSQEENEAFERAMALTGREFMNMVRVLAARSIVMRCLEARFDVDPSGEIMVVDTLCPWGFHLFVLEEEMKINPPIKYVLYEDDNPSKSWSVEAVPIAPHRFQRRKTLPTQWQGLSDEELSTVSGIPGCVFIDGFSCGNQTFEGALAMAKAALTL